MAKAELQDQCLVASEGVTSVSSLRAGVQRLCLFCLLVGHSKFLWTTEVHLCQIPPQVEVYTHTKVDAWGDNLRHHNMPIGLCVLLHSMPCLQSTACGLATRWGIWTIKCSTRLLTSEHHRRSHTHEAKEGRWGRARFEANRAHLCWRLSLLVAAVREGGRLERDKLRISWEVLSRSLTNAHFLFFYYNLVLRQSNSRACMFRGHTNISPAIFCKTLCLWYDIYLFLVDLQYTRRLTEIHTYLPIIVVSYTTNYLFAYL